MQHVIKELLLPLKTVNDYLVWVISRGPRLHVLFLQSIFFVAALLYFINVTMDSSWVGTRFSGQTPETDTIYEENSKLTPLSDVLNKIVIDAALQFRPESQHVKDLDIPHIARQTTVLNELLGIYRTNYSTKTSQDDQQVLRETIEIMQRALYPWITKSIRGNHSYSSFFDLIDSYTEDAGIVICTGKRGGFRWAIHQIVVLRTVLNCTLPIEVFYGGEKDLPMEYRTFIESIQFSFPDSGPIRTVDITEKFPDPDEFLDLPGGWAMRPFAILASSFKNVILTDADTIFLQDPSVLFEQPAYKKYGAIFWHDRLGVNSGPEETYKWLEELLESAKAKNMGRVRESSWFQREAFHEMERYSTKIPNSPVDFLSGAMVVNKTHNLAGVLMACYLNSKKVRDEVTYRTFHGDKESYWISFALASSPYHFVPGYAGGIGRITHPDDNNDIEEICTLQLLHLLESTGEPLWFNNAIVEHKGANDGQYLLVEGWVGHNGRWHGGGKRFPNEFCVNMPEGKRDRTMGLPEPVNRIGHDLKSQIEKIIKEVAIYDALMVQEDLISISQ